MPTAYIDMHLHSRFSRACSKSITLETLEKTAIQKGLNIISISDFTHPIWFREVKSNLKEIDETGLYHYKSNNIYFLLTTEISLIYNQDGKTRKIHYLILAPNMEIVEQITTWLKTKGRVDYDGRPIFGFTTPELVENMMSISKNIMIIPSHCMTPWFGIFGSKSGFNSVKECFKDQTKNIFALETGLSADPLMLWRISSLDNYTLVSNSDSHSANTIRLGRELNVMEMKEFSYKNIFEIIKNKDKNRFLFTIEVNPSLGKYHWDGHRNCDVCLSPKESIKYHNICPVCGRPLTIGVEHRVEELADRENDFIPENAIPFKTLLPLSELIAYVYNTQAFSKKVWTESTKLIKEFGSELNVLLDADKEKMKLLINEKLVDLILKNREGKLNVQPGYDGVYGKIILSGNISIKQPQKRIDSYINK